MLYHHHHHHHPPSPKALRSRLQILSFLFTQSYTMPMFRFNYSIMSFFIVSIHALLGLQRPILIHLQNCEIYLFTTASKGHLCMCPNEHSLFSCIFSSIGDLVLSTNGVVENLIFKGFVGYPSQHSHFIYSHFINMATFNCPPFCLIKQHWTNNYSIELTLQLRWDLFITQNPRCGSPIKPSNHNPMHNILINTPYASIIAPKYLKCLFYDSS